MLAIEDAAHELRMNAVDDEDSQHDIMAEKKKEQAELDEGRADTNADHRKALAAAKRVMVETNWENVKLDVEAAIKAAEDIASANITNKLTHTIGTT